MKHKYLIILLSLILVSCQFFETEKISTQTFYEEEIQTINWNDIDQYPVFVHCEDFSEKKDQERCFTSTLLNVFMKAVEDQVSENMLNVSIQDTIFLTLNVSEKAKFSMQKIEMDSLMIRIFPFLKEALLGRVDSLQLRAPAYKRGIPVKTEFTLPIVITTEDL